MKKIITSMAVATLLLCSMYACKKSPDTQAPQTTLQKIQAKWQIESDLENDHFGGADHIKNSIGGANDYIDFRSDMKVYISAFGYIDIVPYSLAGDTKITITSPYSPVIFDIKTLTSNTLILYQKDIAGPDYMKKLLRLKNNQCI